MSLTIIVENEIREYIRQNPGKTINRVVEYLGERKLLSYVPARNKVLYMIQNGMIQDSKVGNGFHRLFINDKSDFNKIDKQLIDIKNIMEQMNEIVRKAFSRESIILGSDIAVKFVYEYKFYLIFLLQILLVHTAERIQLEKDSQVLYHKIINLMLKLDVSLGNVDRRGFVYARHAKLKRTLKPYSKRKGEFAKSLDNLRKSSDNLQQNMYSLLK